MINLAAWASSGKRFLERGVFFFSPFLFYNLYMRTRAPWRETKGCQGQQAQLDNEGHIIDQAVWSYSCKEKNSSAGMEGGKGGGAIQEDVGID